MKDLQELRDMRVKQLLPFELLPPVHADKEFLIYLAGFFDGEGCISIVRTTGTLVVSLSQSHGDLSKDDAVPNLFRLIYEEFGGHLRYNRLKPPWANQWQWSATTNFAVRFLLATRPYLRVKAKECDVALEYICWLRDELPKKACSRWTHSKLKCSGILQFHGLLRRARHQFDGEYEETNRNSAWAKMGHRYIRRDGSLVLWEKTASLWEWEDEKVREEKKIM